MGLTTQTQNVTFLERKRPERKPWPRGKPLAMRFLNASVLWRKCLNRNLCWDFTLGTLLPKTRVVERHILQMQKSYERCILSENSRRLWLFLGSVQEFCRKVSGKLQEIAGKFCPESRNALNCRISGTGKGKPAADIGSTLPWALC